MAQNKTSNGASMGKGSVNKKTVAVFFGGRSPEHDVSVISALQVIQALDHVLYTPLPVYVSPNGRWYTGDALKKRENFMFTQESIKQLTEVTLDVTAERGGCLLPKKQPFFGTAKAIHFDLAIPAFHGLFGEDGNIQGLFELANIPYTGMRTKASAVLMDKVTTKYLLKAIDVPALDFAVLKRPSQGYLIADEVLQDALKEMKFPCIIKPVHLGSSIGVAKVDTVEDVKACLPAIFEFDDAAIVEPFVENLVEYNVAVARINGVVKTSAIERPKTTDELLDFKQKYTSGGDNKSGSKMSDNKVFSPSSEGMLSLTRDINPDLPEEMEQNIRFWAEQMFEAIDGTGAARIDFICNGETGQVWLNEVNPCPGSFGYFLWEAAEDDPLLFTELLTVMIAEAMIENSARILPSDPVPVDARLLKRSLSSGG